MKKILAVYAVLVGMVVALSGRAMAAPARIVDGWYAHNATLIMLGAADKVVGTVVTPARFPWMYCVAPSLSGARIFGSMVLNAEAVLALHPDLVFVTKESGVAPSLQRLGLKTAPVGFTDFETMLNTIDETAFLLDTDEAKAQAARYRAAFMATRQARPASSLTVLPRVLHIASLDPLTVDGDHSIVDEWIRDAGGRNAASGVHGNKRPVSLEQVLSWQPDLIILGADAGRVEDMASSPLWSRLSAVAQKRVFRNPAGVFNWDRYSPELLLQLIWARELIGNNEIDRKAMIGHIRDFYRDFYRHPIGESEAAHILDAQAPLSDECSASPVSAK